MALVLLETLGAMHYMKEGGGWLHNDLHSKNILVHFPIWEWGPNGRRQRTPKSPLVFMGICDLGCAHPKKYANQPKSKAPTFPNWNVHITPTWPHVAPKLTNANGNYITQPRFYSKYTDVFALGSSIKRMCEKVFVERRGSDFDNWLSTHPEAPFTTQAKAAGNLQMLLFKMASPTHGPEL